MFKTTRLNIVSGIAKEDLHYPVMSLTPIEGVDINKNYRVNPMLWLTYSRGKITLDDLKIEYYKQLGARGKHLIEGDLRETVLVCACENKVHKGDCAIKLLKSYAGISEDIYTADDLKKVDYMADFHNAVVDVKCPECSTELEEDDETGMYCPKCDDVYSFEDLEG